MKSEWIKVDSSTWLLVVLNGVVDSANLIDYAMSKHKTEMMLVLSTFTYNIFEANISENNKNLDKILSDIQEYLK